MHKQLLAITLLLPGFINPTLAENRAVSAFNWNAGASYSDTDYDGVDTDISAVFTNFATPLTPHLGMAASAKLSRVSTNLDTDNYYLDAGLLMRDYQLGMTGIKYFRNEARESSSPDVTHDGYIVKLAGYYHDLDLTALRTHSETDIPGNPLTITNTLTIELGWYTTPDLRLSVGTGHMDYDDYYQAGIIWQQATDPANYSLGFDIVDNNNAKTYTATFTYYFGAGKALQDRFRRDLF